MFGSDDPKINRLRELKKFNIYPKGRRVGATFGAWRSIIKDACKNHKGRYLWGDKLLSDAKKYLLRDHIPFLQNYNIDFEYKQGSNEIRINNLLIDLRGADRPEMWEGFGYDKNFLNEAGIILKKDYLWDNAVLPMMLDNPNSQSFIFGKPLGFNKFKKLWDKRNNDNWQGRKFSTYDNPLLLRSDIDELAKEIPAHQRRQEIYGDFIKLEDAIMNPDWIKRRDVLVKDVVMAVDLAISKNSKADFTAAAIMQRNNDGTIDIIDVERKRLSFNEILQFIDAKAKIYNPKIIGIEQVQFQAAVVQEMTRQTSWNVKALKPESDKVTRFGALATRYEQGLVYHNNSLPEYFENELLNFTGDSKQDDHDDMVDAVSYGYKLLDQVESNIRWM